MPTRKFAWLSRYSIPNTESNLPMLIASSALLIERFVEQLHLAALVPRPRQLVLVEDTELHVPSPVGSRRADGVSDGTRI